MYCCYLVRTIVERKDMWRNDDVELFFLFSRLLLLLLLLSSVGVCHVWIRERGGRWRTCTYVCACWRMRENLYRKHQTHQTLNSRPALILSSGGYPVVLLATWWYCTSNSGCKVVLSIYRVCTTIVEMHYRTVDWKRGGAMRNGTVQCRE